MPMFDEELETPTCVFSNKKERLPDGRHETKQKIETPNVMFPFEK